MQAIEFITKAEDGTIKVPKKYVKSLLGKVRVIILIENEQPKQSKNKTFSALAIETKNLHFTRDEANER
ncbi:hypothetical protein H0X48_00430 [Candidatus Dependentiae bacterium]|nr:hypothetical protein [Candidatus Dependentiae bacterium]